MSAVSATFGGYRGLMRRCSLEVGLSDVCGRRTCGSTRGASPPRQSAGLDVGWPPLCQLRRRQWVIRRHGGTGRSARNRRGVFRSSQGASPPLFHTGRRRSLSSNLTRSSSQLFETSMPTMVAIYTLSGGPMMIAVRLQTVGDSLVPPTQKSRRRSDLMRPIAVFRWCQTVIEVPR